jgi:hypothetical protein
MVETVLGRDFGRVPMRLHTPKKNNGPNICIKANTGKMLFMILTFISSSLTLKKPLTV